MPDISIEKINAGAKEAPALLIKEAEDAYHKNIKMLAERICSGGRVRIVLLSGPSGSGKTTTAKLLSDAIRAEGEDCAAVSLDDFYRSADDPEYPRLPDGERDFEAVGALDIPLLTKTLFDIAEGRAFSVPRYDFKRACRTEGESFPPMKHGVVIIEGLHALNPLVFSPLPKECVLKVFISVSTNITKGEKRIISGRKLRFLRRLVRDSIYRASSAERTLKLWEGVIVGEDKYLYPTRQYADIAFNTFHTFELSVMRPFAEALLSEELAEEHPLVRAVLDAVREAFPIDMTLVPKSSLIREFIPEDV